MRRRAYDRIFQLSVAHNPYSQDPQALFRAVQADLPKEPEASPELDKEGLEDLKKLLNRKK